MKLQYIRAFIVLLAGLIALIINMRTGRDVTVSLLIVLVVILIFYFIGTLVVEILQKYMEQPSDVNDSEEEDEEQPDDTDMQDDVKEPLEEDTITEEEF